MKTILSSVREMSLTLVTGIIVGIIFRLLNFPLPAPPNLAAFMGIFGVWFGAYLIKRVEQS